MSEQAAATVVRLWWRRTLCGRRFDTFGTDHDDPDDRRAAGLEALGHLDGHGLRLERIDDAVARLDPAGRTSRILRHELLRPLSPS